MSNTGAWSRMHRASDSLGAGGGQLILKAHPAAQGGLSLPRQAEKKHSKAGARRHVCL